MIRMQLVGRLIDEVGCRRAVDACLESGLINVDVDEVIAEFIAKVSPRWVLRATGHNGATAAARAQERAEATLLRLVDGRPKRLTDGGVLVLRRLVMYLAGVVGPEVVAQIVVTANRTHVLELDWDSGSIGGSGVVYVHHVGGKYWVDLRDAEYVSAPYRTLRGALRGEGLGINGATTAVRASGLTATRLAVMLSVDADVTLGHAVVINGESWVVGEGPKLKRSE